eukprot:scaffold6611_cov57-Phaeocystis_antarctica.AAC.2
MTILALKEHRSCADGRASTRHLHGKTERAARCLTVKVSAESAGTVDTIIVDHSVKVGDSHTPSQTPLPLTLTVATHSPLGDQPQSDRILRLPCGRLAPAAPYTFALDALKRACRSSSLQASRSARSALSGCRRRAGGRRW